MKHMLNAIGKAALWALVAALLLAGCSPAANTPAPSEPQEPSSSQAPESVFPPTTPSVLSHPEALPQSALQSPALAEVLARGAAINGQDDAATNKEVVQPFLQAVEAGQDARLEVYSFWESLDADGTADRRLVGRVFENRGGTPYIYYLERYNWEGLPEEKSPEYKISSFELTEYGYLVYHPESDSEASSVKVVHDEDIFEKAAERRQLYEKYVRPIYYSGALGDNSWASPAELHASRIWLFEDLYYSEGRDPWKEFGEHWPVETMLEVLGRYFDGFTRQQILRERYADEYDSATDTIFYQGGRGGGPFMLRVTDWAQEGDRLALTYENYDYVTGRPYEGAVYRLTVGLLEDGSFRYLSNAVVEQ